MVFIGSHKPVMGCPSFVVTVTVAVAVTVAVIVLQFSSFVMVDRKRQQDASDERKAGGEGRASSVAEAAVENHKITPITQRRCLPNRLQNKDERGCCTE